VRIQRQVRAVNRKVVLDQAADQLVTLSRPGVGGSPKKSVMHQQKVGFSNYRQPDGCEGRVHGRCDPGHCTIILHLEPVGSPLVILHPCRMQ